MKIRSFSGLSVDFIAGIWCSNMIQTCESQNSILASIGLFLALMPAAAERNINEREVLSGFACEKWFMGEESNVECDNREMVTHDIHVVRLKRQWDWNIKARLLREYFSLVLSNCHIDLLPWTVTLDFSFYILQHQHTVSAILSHPNP